MNAVVWLFIGIAIIVVWMFLQTRLWPDRYFSQASLVNGEEEILFEERLPIEVKLAAGRSERVVRSHVRLTTQRLFICQIPLLTRTPVIRYVAYRTMPSDAKGVLRSGFVRFQIDSLTATADELQIRPTAPDPWSGVPRWIRIRTGRAYEYAKILRSLS